LVSEWFWIWDAADVADLAGRRVRERHQPVWDHQVTGKPVTWPRYRRWGGFGLGAGTGLEVARDHAGPAIHTS
jgi:hypothetical protein